MKIKMFDPWLFLIDLQILLIPPSVLKIIKKVEPKNNEEIEKEKKEFNVAKESPLFECFT